MAFLKSKGKHVASGVRLSYPSNPFFAPLILPFSWFLHQRYGVSRGADNGNHIISSVLLYGTTKICIPHARARLIEMQFKVNVQYDFLA